MCTGGGRLSKFTVTQDFLAQGFIEKTKQNRANRTGGGGTGMEWGVLASKLCAIKTLVASL